jgi:hypothetical protein
MALHFEVVPPIFLVNLGLFLVVTLTFFLFLNYKKRASRRAKKSNSRRRKIEWKLWTLFVAKDKKKYLSYKPNDEDFL